MFFGFFYFRAYDRAAIKFRGVDADINFNVSDYDEDIKQVRIVVDVTHWVLIVLVFDSRVISCKLSFYLSCR